MFLLRAIGIFAFIPSSSFAQEWEVFNMDNAGLPSNTVKELVQDAQGIIWAGTNWGLCRFDGSAWEVIQMQEGGLPENDITALAVDSADRLWIGTALSGIAIYDGTDWEMLNMDNSELPDNTVNGITHDFRGWTWISTAFGLACITDQGWRIYNNTPESHMGFEFFSPNVRDVVVRDDGLVCIGTMNGGLTYLTEEDFIYYTTFNSAFFDNSASEIVLDSNGDRWLASAASGLIRHAGPYDGGPWFNYSLQNSGFPDNTLTSLVIDENDTKFAGTEIGGIIEFPADGLWSAHNTSNSNLPDNRVLSLLIEENGTLWAGTYEGGVARRTLTTAVASIRRSDLHVYPTIFDRSVTVESASDGLDHKWIMIDASGRCVMNGAIKGESRITLDLHDLSQGVHMLILSNDRGRQAVRIMKMER